MKTSRLIQHPREADTPEITLDFVRPSVDVDSMVERAFVIVNPKSANGSTGRNWPELRSALDRVLPRWDHEFTLSRGDACRLARRGVDEGYDMLVSVGGDGTNNEVVTGILDDEGVPLKPNMIVGIVRAGTGGDFARHLGLPNALPKAVQHLAGADTRPCDLGFLTYAGYTGPARRAFLNIASFGLSGVVDDRVNKTTKALGGTASFLVGLFRGLASYRPMPMIIEVDGQPFYDGPVVTCAVANGQYFGGGMRFAKDAKIDDGLFDVVAQTHVGVKEVLSIADLYSGDLVRWPSVAHTRGKVVSARPKNPEDSVLLDVDGEQPGKLPAQFRMLPSAIRLKI